MSSVRSLVDRYYVFLLKKTQGYWWVIVLELIANCEQC